jgi:hypothetical protein
MEVQQNILKNRMLMNIWSHDRRLMRPDGEGRGKARRPPNPPDPISCTPDSLFEEIGWILASDIDTISFSGVIENSGWKKDSTVKTPTVSRGSKQLKSR